MQEIEAIAERCSIEEVLLEISQNLQENTSDRVSFNEVAVIFSYRTPPVATSEERM